MEDDEDIEVMGDEDDDDVGDRPKDVEVDSDVDDIDFDNFKGIHFNDDPNSKY